MTKTVFVSGCFDMLHSGHVEFFQQAAAYGDLIVALGSDRTLFELKGRVPFNSEEERKFMIESVSCIKEAFISKGSGYLDFEIDLRERMPDIFIVNEDGNTPQKRGLMKELGIEYVVLKRDPRDGLLARSTTAIRGTCRIPYRIDVAGGWLDQPFVSKHHPGAVVTVSLEPTIDFNERSGMASSTRRSAIELWGNHLPLGIPEKNAKVLFCYDNPPGTKEISGAQDSIGIAMPGLTYSFFKNEYWPSHFETITDEAGLDFVENLFYLIPLGPRHDGYAVLDDTNITSEGAKRLADAADGVWEAIKAKNAREFGKHFKASFDAQIEMFPNMMTPIVAKLIDEYKNRALGWKLSGAGGGGYLILVSEEPVENGVRVAVRGRNGS
ncbi:MAG: adenylyltransferase/cytidyltransferase family protein [Anaerolineaceae bacterium]|nr:adenylyltransferase/cytidyltransferase family protein [Anaerolineaceae bacterium]